LEIDFRGRISRIGDLLSIEGLLSTGDLNEGGSGTDVQAALSFFVERYGNVEVIGHSGNQNGFLSHLYLHRPSRTAYAVAFNTDASSKSRGKPRITRDVDDAVRDRLLEEIAAKR
jgi:hypothetical protein